MSQFIDQYKIDSKWNMHNFEYPRHQVIFISCNQLFETYSFLASNMKDLHEAEMIYIL